MRRSVKALVERSSSWQNFSRLRGATSRYLVSTLFFPILFRYLRKLYFQIFFSHLILSSSGPRAYPEELLGADEGGGGEPSHRPQGQGEDGDVVEDEDD